MSDVTKFNRTSLFNCREPVAPRVIPIFVGDEKMVLNELRRRHFARDIDEATRAWAILEEGVAVYQISFESQGHRLAAGQQLKSDLSREGLLNMIPGLTSLRSCECLKGKIPWCGSDA